MGGGQSARTSGDGAMLNYESTIRSSVDSRSTGFSAEPEPKPSPGFFFCCTQERMSEQTVDDGAPREAVDYIAEANGANRLEVQNNGKSLLLPRMEPSSDPPVLPNYGAPSYNFSSPRDHSPRHGGPSSGGFGKSISGNTRLGLPGGASMQMGMPGGGAAPSIIQNMSLHPAGAMMSATIASIAQSQASPQGRSLADLDWINKVLIYLWPRCDKMARNIIRKEIVPLIRAEVPKIGDHIDIMIDLGNKPPTIGPINAFCEDEAREIITLEIDINWKAELQVKLKAAIITVTIDKVEVTGRLVVAMKPLINEIPLVGSLHFYFLNPPNIDMRINVSSVGMGMNIASLIKGMVNQQIIDLAVLPNRVLNPVAPFPLMKDLNLLHNPLPQGLIRIKVHECINLPAADMSLVGAGSSDPFVKISIGGKFFKSSTQFGTRNPKWAKENKENCENYFYFTKHQRVKIEIWDYDMASGDDLLGTVREITVRDMVGDKWFDIDVTEEFMKKGLKEDSKLSKRARVKNFFRGGSTKSADRKSGASEPQEMLLNPPQIRMSAEFFDFSDHSRHVSTGSDTLMCISIRGVRKNVKGTEDDCVNLTCSVTVFGETRSTTPALPNNSSMDPDLAGIDIQMVHKLAQLHNLEAVAKIMEVPETKIEALMRGGHTGVWFHTFYYYTKKHRGTAKFAIGDASEDICFDELQDMPDMKISKLDFKIGEYFVDVEFDLKAVVRNNKPFQ